MNNNAANTELLVQYLDGELDIAQTAALKKNIQDDPLMAEELENLRLAKSSLNSYGLKKRIGSIHEEMMQERIKSKPLKKQGILAKIIPYTMRVAACALVITGISVLYQYYAATPEKLFTENFQTFNLHQSRSTTANAIENAYLAGDMKAVVQQYELLKTPGPENNFFAGNAYLSMQQPAKAIAVFVLVEQQNKLAGTHYYEEDTEYYLALAYLLNKQPAMALPLLEKINADNKHAYHKKVSNWFLMRVKRFHAAK